MNSTVLFDLPQTEIASLITDQMTRASRLLGGLNGEAAVLLEGTNDSPEFEKVRKHIATARSQAVVQRRAIGQRLATTSISRYSCR